MRTPLEDSLSSVLLEAQEVQWGTLRGAYGLSDASDHYRDVPRMLSALAELDDLDSASWGDAYDDFFLSHVWHQYSIYPVTPVVSGFLIRIAALRSVTALEPAKQIASRLWFQRHVAVHRNRPSDGPGFSCADRAQRG